MHISLRLFRYFVFGLFLTCNTIIAIVAVLNLNLPQDAPVPSSSPALHTDAYLVFVGCAGLALIFPVLFCELARKSVFLVAVWFESIWVALFSVMMLAGAASASASSDELCAFSVLPSTATNRSAICTSNKVVQAFSWICGLFLLSYFIMLFATSILRRKDDQMIWRCNVGRFPWASAQHKLQNSVPGLPSGAPRESAPKRRSKVPSISAAVKRLSLKTPIIAAPRPRNAATEAVRQAILSYRSGLSGDYSIEHFCPEDPALDASREHPLQPPPLALAPEAPSMTTRQAAPVTFGHSLYPQHMQKFVTVSPERQAPTQPPPRQPPSPSPIGEWPRMNPPIPQPKRRAGTCAQPQSNRDPPSSILPVAVDSRPISIRPLPTVNFEGSSPASARHSDSP